MNLWYQNVTRNTWNDSSTKKMLNAYFKWWFMYKKIKVHAFIFSQLYNSNSYYNHFYVKNILFPFITLCSFKYVSGNTDAPRVSKRLRAFFAFFFSLLLQRCGLFTLYLCSEILKLLCMMLPKKYTFCNKVLLHIFKRKI